MIYKWSVCVCLRENLRWVSFFQSHVKHIAYERCVYFVFIWKLCAAQNFMLLGAQKQISKSEANNTNKQKQRNISVHCRFCFSFFFRRSFARFYKQKQNSGIVLMSARRQHCRSQFVERCSYNLRRFLYMGLTLRPPHILFIYSVCARFSGALTNERIILILFSRAALSLVFV